MVMCGMRWEGRIVPRLETRCWQKAKTLKGALEEEANYSYQKNLKKMEEEAKRNTLLGTECYVFLTFFLLIGKKKMKEMVEK
jgi:hypothetical protein